MPFLSDYLNFNGVPGTQGPQGYQGEPSVSLVFRGHDSWDNIALIPDPEVGDVWELVEPVAGAPDSADGPAVPGDNIVWNGDEWVNLGQLDVVTGPQGPQGFQGDQGLGFAFKGTATWDYIANLTAMIVNDLWILVDADPNAPPIDDPDIGPLRPAKIGDAVAWTGVDWENLGPIAGPEGPQGPQGYQGFQGIEGTDGVSDVPGPEGPEGPQGDPAASVIIKGSDTWANISSLPSPVQNEGWFLTDATGAPDSPYGTAAIGDLVIFDGTATWTNAGPLQGPQGDAGAQGAEGADGADGAQGASGAKGDTGSQGATGPQGAPGEKGADSTVAGPQGATGSQGATGAQGARGTTGPEGDQGDDGPQGPPGTTGAQGSASTVPGPQGDDGADGGTGPQGPQGPQGDGIDPDESVTSPAGPIEINSGVASLSMTGVSASGTVTYLVVGNYVFLSGRLSWSSGGSSANVTITGIPFVPDYATGYHPSYKGVRMGGTPDAGRTVHGRIEAGSSTINLIKMGESGDEAALVGNNCDAGGHVNVNIGYYSIEAAAFFSGETDP